MINDDATSFQLRPSPADQQIFRCFNSPIPVPNLYHKPRKKRTKLIKTDYTAINTSSNKPKYCKKPDPAAPKITRPCTECGKTFWSWKALFGHMRCHPERQWRGINPPANLRRPEVGNAGEELMTEEDHHVATCLLMLANGPTALEAAHEQGVSVSDSETNCRFECSSCKKVFGSHQALGGHRASHKNVKGCFAINRNGDGEEDEGVCVNTESFGGRIEEEEIIYDERDVMGLGHKCSICLRVFASGQALGGHKKCHWEKGDEPPSLITHVGFGPGFGIGPGPGCGLDLNLPTNIEGDSGLRLDLRLGL